MACQGWDRADNTDSTCADWWQRQTSSWEAPTSWSDPWMTSSWSGQTDNTQADWKYVPRATSSFTHAGCESIDTRILPKVLRDLTERYRDPSPLVRRGNKVLPRQQCEQDD